MPRALRVLVLGAFVCGLLTFPLAAGAGHTTDPAVNLAPLGHIQEPAVLGGFGGANPDINTDIAFWGKFAYQGNWDGFSIRDIRNKNNPTTVSRTFCDGNQGDIVVWKNVLVRSWNTPAGSPGPFGAGLTCDGQMVPAGFEGLHVFDIGNRANPEFVADIELSASRRPTPSAAARTRRPPCLTGRTSGSLSTTARPRAPRATGSTSSRCRWTTRRPPRSCDVEPSMHTCHDIGVILGDVKKAACAGGDWLPRLQPRRPRRRLPGGPAARCTTSTCRR